MWPWSSRWCCHSVPVVACFRLLCCVFDSQPHFLSRPPLCHWLHWFMTQTGTSPSSSHMRQENRKVSPLPLCPPPFLFHHKSPSPTSLFCLFGSIQFRAVVLKTHKRARSHICSWTRINNPFSHFYLFQTHLRLPLSAFLTLIWCFYPKQSTLPLPLYLFLSTSEWIRGNLTVKFHISLQATRS